VEFTTVRAARVLATLMRQRTTLDHHHDRLSSSPLVTSSEEERTVRIPKLFVTIVCECRPPRLFESLSDVALIGLGFAIPRQTRWRPSAHMYAYE